MSSAPDRYRPTVIEIDLGAFERNVRAVVERLAARAKLVAVLKGDGYGHGAVDLALACEELPVAMIAVALVEEALELRRAGIRLPILLMGPLSPEEAVAAAENELMAGISSPDALDAVRNFVVSSGREAHVHLKIDSGMGRLGLLEEDLPFAADAFASTPGLRLDAVFTQFANASNPDDPLTDRQIERFREMIERLRALGVAAPLQHSANSAALMRDLVSPGDYVRAGLALYGGEALDRGSSRLEPVMRWSTRVVRVKSLPTGHAVGYGATWRTERPSRIATLPVGYADGFDRAMSNRGEVLIRGRRFPIVGRISMDITLVDVTDLDKVEVGDEAVLLGCQGSEEIPAEELAKRIETIPYEIFTRVGPRVPRVVRKESIRR